MPSETPVENIPNLSRLTASDFTVAQVQVALFTPDEEVSSAKLSRGLLPEWERWFDGESFVLPIGGPIPREVPRVILQTQDSAWRCEISSERISIFWRSTTPAAVLPDDFSNRATQFLNEYATFLRARVGRVAAILTRFAPHPSPGLFLSRHFCQARWLERPLNRPENFELHAHKVFLLADRFTVNSWVRCKTAMASTPEGPVRCVAVEQDLNTLQEEAATKQFAPDEVQAFFGVVMPEFDGILRQYFPTEERL